MITDLKRMGYRKLKDDVYGKPVGYHLFLVQKLGEVWEFTNRFKGAADGKLHVYDREKVSNESELKYAESCATMTRCGWDSDFSFLTMEEMFDL